MSLITFIDRIDQLVTDRAPVSEIKPHLVGLRDQAEALEKKVKTRNDKTLTGKLEAAFEEEKEKLQTELVALKAELVAAQSDLVAHQSKAEAEAKNHQTARDAIAGLKKQIEELQAKTPPNVSGEEWHEAQQRIFLLSGAQENCQQAQRDYEDQLRTLQTELDTATDENRQLREEFDARNGVDYGILSVLWDLSDQLGGTMSIDDLCCASVDALRAEVGIHDLMERGYVEEASVGEYRLTIEGKRCLKQNRRQE